MPLFRRYGPDNDFMDDYIDGNISNFKKFVSGYKKYLRFFDSSDFKHLINASIDRDDYEVFKFLLNEAVNNCYDENKTYAVGGSNVKVFISSLDYYNFLKKVLVYTMTFAKFEFFKEFINFFFRKGGDYIEHHGVSIIYTTLIDLLSNQRVSDFSKYKPFIGVALSFYSPKFSSVLMDKAEEKFK